MVHTTSTLQPQSVRLLLALARMHGFNTRTSDVGQAYLHSAEPLARGVFIRNTVPEFKLHPSQCFRLIKPLYGLCLLESGDIWHDTLDKHHIQDLGMKALRSNPALYILMEDGLLQGLSGGYVNDLIRARDALFKKLSKKATEKFEITEDQSLPCMFTGFSLSRAKDGTITQEQHAYLKSSRNCLLTLPSVIFVP